ncbi:MAG: conjugal transfer protein TraG N-terminal domain-containing protein [Geminicoccaceae bacterium]
MDEIYSIGDSAFLYGVLQAVAAVAQTDEYGMLAKIGLMLGVILVMVRAALSGGTQFPVGQLLGCLLLYTAFFGPSRQVTIIDVYSGSVRTVDHVPAGVAIAGAQISSFGYNITELMEQAFATPRMTEQGYGGALEILKRVRLATLNVYSLQMATAPTADADLPRSWQQYIADCPLKGLQNELRHKTADEIWNKPLMTEGLRFESNGWGTRLDLTRPYTEPTCSEAHQQLVEYTNVVYLPYFKDVLAKKLRYASVAELEEKVEMALSSMGLTANADTYLMTSALSSVYFAAIRQRAAEDFQPAYAAAVDDAVQQRNAQWMADESLFQVYVRPLLTFLEGFTYAMAPVLVLLVGLGPYGMQVIAGFVVTLIWIFTWMPSLAVVNFFQHLTAAGKLEALAANGAGIDTMAGLFQADSIVQTYLATGGNMAAAAPALTASIVFIGARAFGANLMAQRLSSGQDTFKEEKASPDSVHAGATVNYQSPFTHTPTAGMTTMTAAERVTPSYSWSSSQSLAVSSADSRSQGLSRGFAETAGRRVAASFGSNESGAVAGVFNSHEAASKSHSLAAAQEWNAAVSTEHAGSEAITDEMRTHIAYGVSLGIPAKRIAEALGVNPKYVPGGNVDGSLNGTQAGSTSNAETLRIATQMGERYRNDQAYQAQFGQALAYDVNQRHEDSVFANQSVQDDRGLQRQASEVLGAQQEYRRMAAANQGVGQQISVSEPDLVGRLRNNEKAIAFVDRKVFEHGLQGEARRAEWLTKELYPDGVGRELAADVRTLLTSPSISSTQRAMITAELGDLLGYGSGRDLGDAEQHAGIGPGMGSMGTIEGKVARKDELGADIQAGSTAKLNQIQQEVAEGQGHVAQRSAENNASVQHHQDINKVDAQLHTEAADEAATELGRDKNLASLVHDGHERVKDWIKERPEWVADMLNPLPPSVTEQIGPPPPPAPEEPSNAPKEGESPSGKAQPE